MNRGGTLRARLEAMADPLGLLEGLFAHSPVPYAVFSADGYCLLTNPAYRTLFGTEPPPEYNIFRDEVTERLGLVALLRRAFEGETVQTPVFWYDPKELRHIQVVDAQRAAISCTCFPLGSPGGEVRHVAIAYKDVTAEMTLRDAGQERLRALANTSTALAQATTDFQAALEALAQLVSETLGECCVLTLLDEKKPRLEVVASYHPDPEARQLLKTTVYGSYGSAEGPPMRVLKTGQPVLVPCVPQAGILESLSPRSRPFVERFGMHSILLVPLRAQGKVIGTLGATRGRPGQPYTLEDQHFLQELADRAGLTIQNVRLLKTAQEAVRLRDDFLSIASHELKTPLTPLSLKLQGLTRVAERVQDPDLFQRLTRDVEVMRRQVKRLSDLISDLLDVARISGGRLKLQLEPVELSGLVREVASRFEPEAERTGGSLDVLAGEPLVGNWDRLRLEQVVTNLLSNALKYGAGKPVHVHLAPAEGQARLTVWDEGIGIEPDHLARIFEKFERAVSERHYGGLGLGLYITQQIVQALGGTISVRSTPSKGASFTVLLPLGGPAATGA
jgi:signal transduction histidine kinase